MNVFINAVQWSSNNLKSVGLPRPYFNVDERFYTKNKKRYLAKRVPVPYQSMPGEGHVPIKLNIDNEKEAISKDLCSYCGIKINDEEISIRWKIEVEADFFYEQRDFVPTDFHPLHIECMRQARIYCPFMRTLKDIVFDVKKQKYNLEIAKENYKKYFTINWENKNRDYSNLS
jgi:hypothetical protein